MRGLKWVILSVFLFSGVAWAEEKPKTVEVWKNVFTLTHGEGIDSNTTFIISNEGVIVVDTRVTPAEAKR